MRVDRPVRLSVSLSPVVLSRVKALARAQGWSRNRVMADIVRPGLDVHDREREHFLAVAGRLARATGEAELEALQEELARLTFGS
jgi:hypothetical protein